MLCVMNEFIHDTHYFYIINKGNTKVYMFWFKSQWTIELYSK